MPDTPEPGQFPLAFATLPELIAEIRRRASSLCLSLIPLMQEDQANTEESAYTAVEGRPTDLAWMAVLIMSEVQLGMMQYRQSHHTNFDSNLTDPEDLEDPENLEDLGL